jgi:hypothetical protein
MFCCAKIASHTLRLAFAPTLINSVPEVTKNSLKSIRKRTLGECCILKISGELARGQNMVKATFGSQIEKGEIKNCQRCSIFFRTIRATKKMWFYDFLLFSAFQKGFLSFCESYFHG